MVQDNNEGKEKTASGNPKKLRCTSSDTSDHDDSDSSVDMDEFPFGQRAFKKPDGKINSKEDMKLRLQKSLTQNYNTTSKRTPISSTWADSKNYEFFLNEKKMATVLLKNQANALRRG